MSTNTITIDLVPYPVEVTEKSISILECGGSILSKLDNRHSVTKNRFSEDHVLAEIGESVCYVEYADDILCITPCHSQELPSFDDVIQWVSNKYDAIESIGWEVLTV